MPFASSATRVRRATATTLLVLLALTANRAHAENGCLAGDFLDLRGLAVVGIGNTDPNNPFRYRPRCAMVVAGTTIRFTAVPGFEDHPLYAGTIENGMPVMDPSSPIGSITSGTEADRVMPAAGEFSYFCDIHFQMGMQGSILVVPEQIFADGFDSSVE